MLLVVPAAYDDVVDPGKSCMAIPDGPVQVLLEGWPFISEAKEHPLYSNRPKGVMMAVFCMYLGLTGIWWYPFLRSILEKMVHHPLHFTWISPPPPPT
jgi:hypothetical protein